MRAVVSNEICLMKWLKVLAVGLFWTSAVHECLEATKELTLTGLETGVFLVSPSPQKSERFFCRSPSSKCFVTAAQTNLDVR